MGENLKNSFPSLFQVSELGIANDITQSSEAVILSVFEKCMKFHYLHNFPTNYFTEGANLK